jgi:hypothetical protein
LTVKASLIFEKLNRFLDLNFSFLHAHLWESDTAGHWSLLVASSILPLKIPKFWYPISGGPSLVNMGGQIEKKKGGGREKLKKIKTLG